MSSQVGLVEGQVDTFSITARGMECLHPTQTFHRQVLLVNCRLHSVSSDVSELAAFEAIQELSRQGWTYQQVKSNLRTIEPCTANGTKVWYFSGSLPIHYLRALLSLRKLFDLGLKELHHCQPSAYYKTILLFMKSPARLNQVRAWQSLPYYKLLQQRKNRAMETEEGRFDERSI